MEGKRNTFFLCANLVKPPIPNLEQKRFLLSGSFDIGHFRESLRYIIRQDPSLLQHHIDIFFRDLSAFTDEQQAKVLSDYQRYNHVDIVDQGWWMQFSFFQTSANDVLLIWTIHDEKNPDRWKSYLLFELLFDVYGQLSHYETIDHSLSWVEGQEVSTHWKAYLESFDLVTPLPKRLPESETGMQKQKLNFQLDVQQSALLNQWLEKENVSRRALYQAAWAILLWRYHGENQVMFAGTSLHGLRLPVCAQMTDEMTVFNLIHQIEDDFERGKLFPYVTSSHNFEHMIHVASSKDHIDDVSLLCLDEIEQLDLYLHINESNMDIYYATDRFSSWQIEQLVVHLQNILQQIYKNPHLLLQDVEILTLDEKHHLLSTLNQNALQLPDVTTDQLIAKQASKQPGQLAIVSEQGDWTYQMLDERSDQLAAILQNKGVGSGDIVALLVKPSPWMFVGMLGVLKAGAAFLPIDPNYPDQRIRYILADSKAELLLTNIEGLDVPFFAGEIVQFDTYTFHQADLSIWAHRHEFTDPAYVIYTSGSTGRPKGVVIGHGALLNLVTWHNDFYELTPADQCTKYAGFGFDASVWEVFPALVAGATIHIVPERIRHDLDGLHQYFTEHKITLSFLPTQMAEQFSKQDHPTLRVLLTGGDQLRQIASQSYHIANNYGPTENTIVSTSGYVDPNAEIMSIGKPIANTRAYILSQTNQLQPVGVAGELCFSGEQLAIGYLDQPELTQSRFVANPYEPSQRMYRTGDLARWLPDGNIEFLGRIDNQVKIRGYRIELGEIESSLLQQSGVQAALVQAPLNPQKERVLCAYVVLSGEVQEAELSQKLAQLLPEYMIPSYWVRLREIPLTANGKIDYQALPAPDWMPAEDVSGVAGDQKVSATQQKLIALWEEVLGVSSVQLRDHFFRLGGHSLKATALISRIRQGWGVKISFADFFNYPTVAEMGNFIDASPVEVSSLALLESSGEPDQAYFAVSSVQKRLYALEQTKQMGTTYHTPVVWKLDGLIDLTRLKFVVKALIERHEAFRTSFELFEGELMQRIHSSVDFEISQMQAQDEDEARQIVASFIRPFNLEQAPLFRLGLIQITDEQHILIWDMHHLICDGVSMKILHEEFAKLYQNESLPPISYQYRHYAQWQQNQLQNKTFEVDENYWLEQFPDGTPITELPTDYPRPITQQFHGRKEHFLFDAELTRKCKQFSLLHDVTLYMTLLSAYHVMLAKYTSQTDIVTGSVFAGRTEREWESVFGMFVGTIPIRSKVSHDQTCGEFINLLKSKLIDGQLHGMYPFDELTQKLNTEWDPRRNPIFDTVFVLQNLDIDQMQIPGVTVSNFPYDEEGALFDLTWEVFDAEQIELRVEYNTALYGQETVQRMIKHYVHILEQMIDNPTQKLAAVELITAGEHDEIVKGFNRTDRYIPRNQTVVDLLAARAYATPDQIAVVHGGQNLTYHELHEQTNQLAHLLRSKGVGPNKVVSLLCDSSIDLFVGILAIIKAGGAYLPIDPSYPLERIRYMLADSESLLLLTSQKQSMEELFEGEIVDLTERAWILESNSDVSSIHTPDDLAYIIYTSGSTGKPKGVMVSHRALSNLVTWHNQYYQVTELDRSTKYAGVGFDASVLEIFPYLIAGATIYVIDSAIRHDIYAINQFLIDNQITFCFLPTAIAEPFMELENHSLRALLTGGAQLQHITEQAYRVYDNYGPTENAVITTCYAVQHGKNERLTIGKPVFNNQVYIVNKDLQLLPVGVPGELCISGQSLATGYLHKPELTAEKFVDNPFVPGKKMYRTGDLARWLPDGQIEYLGRIDHQVQIRGFRVELGEIENNLLQHELVKEVVVTANVSPDQQQVLCAYVVPKASVTETELRRYLETVLPDYMVPVHWFLLESFPLTANGKIDNQALPKPIDQQRSQSAYFAPITEIQQILAVIWQEVLGIEQISIHDHFFTLGGDSVKAIQVAAKLHQHQLKLAVSELMEHPTIAELAQYVTNEVATSEPESMTGEIPLTPIQRWFFDQPIPNQAHWNQSVMLTTDDEWNLAAIRQSFAQLVEHHDILRTRFVQADGQISQILQNTEQDCFTIDVFSLAAEKERLKMQQIANRLQRSLHLENGPLIRLVVFECEAQQHLLLIVHHLLIDGISWRILIDDFMQGYQAICSQTEIQLPVKSDSFQLYANQLVTYSNSKELLQEIPYWRDMEQHKVSSLVDADYKREQVMMTDSRAIEFRLTQDQTSQLLQDSHHAYRTDVNDLLLTSLCAAMREWKPLQRLAITLEGHGRESIIEANMTRTIGWFTSMFPVVFDLYPSGIGTLIKEVKETLRRIPNKGIGYGVLRYLTHQANKTDLHFQLQPELSFNYLGQFDQAIEFAGVSSDTKHLGDTFSPETPMHPIEVYGIVIQNELRVRMQYHRPSIRPESAQRLLDLYQHFLLQVANHCVNQKEPNFTASDFSATDVNSAELDQFLESLD